ncbi:MAG: glycosyltransferase family 2 protein [Verrucomicrobiota bacterium]
MKTNSPILTIAIPTYNRAAKLQAQLERLLPQLTPAVRLCVYDNASPDNTQEVVAKFPGVGYFRAVTNCGAGRNIFRCFEECSTEWLWVLSDDDLASTTAVADLLAILAHETCDFVHVSLSCVFHDRETVVSDLPSLLQNAELGHLLWISAGIYRVNSFRPLFRLFNDAVFTWGPHLVMVLALLESSGGSVRLSPVRLPAPTIERPPGWSTLDILLRFSLVPEYLVQPDKQRLVASRIFVEMFNAWMLQGLRETNGNQRIRKWKRINRQARQNLKAYHGSGIWSHVLKHWYRAGFRKSSFQMALQSIEIRLLSWSPVWLFHFLVRRMPLPQYIRDDYYNRRNEYLPYV